MAMDWENYGHRQYERNNDYQRSSYQGSRGNSYQVRHYTDSVEGNTVRKANAVPERRREEVPKRQERHYPERKPVKIPGINGRAFLFLMLMLSLVVGTGFSYLTVKNEVSKQKSEIVSLQSEIAEMKEQNDELQQSIINSVNLADIYKIATEKLKMVHAGENQVYTYSNKKSDMVKRYADIPGVDD